MNRIKNLEGYMNIKIFNLALAGFFLTLIGINMNVNAEETAIEWAPFIKLADVTDRELIARADSVNREFLVKQKGFLKRELIKKNDNEYADVVYWETRSDGVAAGEKISTCVKCSEYFELMKMNEKAGEGFSHYIILKSWKR